MTRKPLSIVLLASLLPAPLLSWGPEGHEIIARIAEARLSAKVRREVQNLLGARATLASVSNWADEIRPRRPRTGPWHFVNIPVTAARGSEIPCPAEGCIVGVIHEMTAMLRDERASAGRREEALKFLIHLVGDLHQPLHCGDRNDRGGNDVAVRYGRLSTNLHRIWDTDVVRRLGRDPAAIAEEINESITPARRRRWAAGTVEDWTWDSWEVARTSVYGRLPKPASPRAKTIRLGDEYMEKSAAAARDQLGKGGIRLARILADTWP